MLTDRESKWGRGDEALGRQEVIERFHESIAYHQRKIDEYEEEIKLLEGKVKLSEGVMEMSYF